MDYFVEPRVPSVNLDISESTIISGIDERDSRIWALSSGFEAARLKCSIVDA
jgi:hypothetical protein